VVTALTPDGRRVLANTADADLMDAMTREAWEGRPVTVVRDATTNRLEA
jgi:hypothetical protein